MLRGTAMTSAPSFPERVGRYALLAPIGSGGLANVYLGRTEGIGGFSRHVAVKILHPHLREQRELIDQLIQEAKVVSQIHHPNVVQVIDVGEDSSGVFIVMDYVEGEALAWLLKSERGGAQPIPGPVKLKILSDALEGLHAAHRAEDAEGNPLGVVHRDFSPQNLMVGTDGVTRLIDFGVAKLARSSVQTKTGLIKGKVAYMSPEQTRGHAVDERCDVWAAGVVIWEAMAGRRLFKREDDLTTMLEIASGEIPDLGEEPSAPPVGAIQATRVALRREIDERCASAGELRKLLLSGPEPVATTEQVAAYVRAAAAPRLAERRQRIERIRELRKEIGELGDLGGTPTSVGPAAASAREESDTRHSLSQPTQGSLGKSRRTALLAVVGLGLVGAAALGIANFRGSKGAQESASDVQTVPAAPEEHSAPAVAPVEQKTVKISASEPMASLSVAGREIPLAVAANTVEVKVKVEFKQLVIQAETADGRATSYISETIPEQLRLEFPPAIAKSDPKKPARGAAPKPKPARSGATPRDPGPLSPSPYRKKP